MIVLKKIFLLLSLSVVALSIEAKANVCSADSTIGPCDTIFLTSRYYIPARITKTDDKVITYRPCGDEDSSSVRVLRSSSVDFIKYADGQTQKLEWGVTEAIKGEDTALFLAILSLVSIAFVYTLFLSAPLAIFGLIKASRIQRRSRGRSKKARTAMILASIALGLNLVFWAGYLVLVLSFT